MLISKASVIDNKTHLEIVASECSFNQACEYLECKMKNCLYKGLEACGINITKIVFDRRTFLYDEERGLLLGY